MNCDSPVQGCFMFKLVHLLPVVKVALKKLDGDEHIKME